MPDKVVFTPIKSAAAPMMPAKAVSGPVYYKQVMGVWNDHAIVLTTNNTFVYVTTNQASFQVQFQTAQTLSELNVGPQFMGTVDRIPNLPLNLSLNGQTINLSGPVLAYEMEALDPNAGWVDSSFLNNPQNLFALSPANREQLVVRALERYTELLQAGYLADAQLHLNTITGDVLISPLAKVSPVEKGAQVQDHILTKLDLLLTMVGTSSAVNSAKRNYEQAIKTHNQAAVRPQLVLPVSKQTLTFVSVIQAQSSQGKPASWLVINLSGVKYVNDTQGHVAGNALLKTVEAKLRSIFGTDAFIVRDGSNFSVYLGQDVAKKQAMQRVLQELSVGIKYEYDQNGQNIIKRYTRETQGKDVCRVGVLSYEPDANLTSEAIGFSRSQQIFYLNRPSNPNAGSRIGQEYVITKEMKSYLEGMTVQKRRFNSHPRLVGEGPNVEKRSGLNNVTQLAQDMAQYLAQNKSVLYGSMDLNATSAFRSFEELGDLMINAIMEDHMAEVAALLPKGIKFYRHGSNSEEFYFMADAEMIGEQQFQESLQQFLKNLSEMPLRIKASRQELEQSEMGRRHLKRMGQEHGQSQEFYVDIADVVRGKDGVNYRGITGTISYGTIDPSPNLSARTIAELQRVRINSLGEKAKDPQRTNVIVKAEGTDAKLLALPVTLINPKPIDDSSSAGRQFLDEYELKIQLVDNGPNLPHYTVGQLKELGLEPIEGFVYKDMVYRVSASFDYMGHQAMVLYYSTGGGNYRVGLVYKSDRSLAWQTPAYWMQNSMIGGSAYPFEVMEFMEKSSQIHKIELDPTRAIDLGKALVPFASGSKQDLVPAISIGQFTKNSPRNWQFIPGFEPNFETTAQPFKIKDSKNDQELAVYLVRSANKLVSYLFMVDAKGNASVQVQANEFVPNEIGVNQKKVAKEADRLTIPLREKQKNIPVGYTDAYSWTNQLPPVRDFLQYLGIESPQAPLRLFFSQEELDRLAKGQVLSRSVAGKDMFVIMLGNGSKAAIILPDNLLISHLNNKIMVSDSLRSNMSMVYGSDQQLLIDIQKLKILGSDLQLVVLP